MTARTVGHLELRVTTEAAAGGVHLGQLLPDHESGSGYPLGVAGAHHDACAQGVHLGPAQPVAAHDPDRLRRGHHEPPDVTWPEPLDEETELAEDWRLELDDEEDEDDEDVGVVVAVVPVLLAVV